MTSYNRVVLLGNLTRDPELRTVGAGSTVADLGLAMNERHRNKAGELVEDTCFVDVVTWGRQAETCNQYLKKGAPILVEGRLQLDQWKSAEGQNRSRLRVRADRIRFMGSGKRQGGAPDATPAKTDAGKAEVPF